MLEYDWLSEASARSDADGLDVIAIATAQHALGVFYYAGFGAPQDYVQAYKWFSLAAAHSHPSCAEIRGSAIVSRDFVMAKLTAGQLSEAAKLAREWNPNSSAVAMPRSG
jgi:TPR repeat protein